MQNKELNLKFRERKNINFMLIILRQEVM